ncbi:MAG: ABC transporter substrate-binding protein [Gammaproteobacteria bacterium]|nr:ABC transporter substrate-binding protein [Gammaproteobacteria bacterium]MCP5136019.1 ABC transporter substrate-binding protein [Gammaproteobacteria bacterium]
MFPLRSLILCVCVLLAGCGERAWNDPYPGDPRVANTLYTSFRDPPKHLDPARSYAANEWIFISQIYEPPLQYHYLKRPHQLMPALSASMPTVRPLSASGYEVWGDVKPAQTVYEIRIPKGVRYQPHPAFADNGSVDDLLDPARLLAQPDRELIAEDLVYQIKRLAHPALASPIYGLMSEYITGLGAYRDTLEAAWAKQGRAGWLDLRQFPLAGAEVVDRYTLRIHIDGSYPQFIYWLATPFFAPIPWEADRFYARPGMAERNLSLDTHPIGSGPYLLLESDPNRRITLARNPNWHGETYPVAGPPDLLADAGKALPFIDRAVYTLEKESIPYWGKFLQGWYDHSGISSDSFDSAVAIGASGDVQVTEAMQAKGIKLQTETESSIFYLGFNWLDPVVGGDAESARLLRRALAIAVDYEEFIAIFRNGRGIAAQGPLAPGIAGYREGEAGINPMTHEWVDGHPQRRALAEARELLAQAGYADGVDPLTGKPLLLYLDAAASSGPDSKAMLDWWRKQIAKLGLRLVVRDTDYNRFQDKMRKGQAQLFQWGWNADYPDPENFLFLFYGPNGKAAHGGENAANYANPEFDALFERMKDLPNGDDRQAVIDRMVGILREDVPWLFGFHPVEFRLNHAWLYNVKPNLIARNTLKYQRVDAEARAAATGAWNRPVLWPLSGLLIGLLVLVAPGWWALRQRERRVGVEEA